MGGNYVFNDKDMNKIENLIGQNCKILGSFTGNGLLKIDGLVEGDIIWEDTIILDQSSLCIGNISCKNALVNGKIQGNIICSETLTIEKFGEIVGDITMPNLVISQGGKFTGNCNMLSCI